MKRTLFALALIVLSALIFISGCIPKELAPSNFNLIFKSGVGAKNELNTFNNTYTKDMVMDPPITINLSLSKEEMNKIYQKMLEINFFDYPENFSVPADYEVTPSQSYYFKVEHDSRIKELQWGDKSPTEENEKAEKLRELIQLIINIIESKEAYKNLPPAKGGYI